MNMGLPRIELGSAPPEGAMLPGYTTVPTVSSVPIRACSNGRIQTLFEQRDTGIRQPALDRTGYKYLRSRDFL